MVDASALFLGIGLGLRHATDADHVAVVSALIQREPGAWRAARVAMLWGLGHTGSFLAVGLLIVLAGVRIPASFERAVDLVVAAMLIGLGLIHLLRSKTAKNAEANPCSVPAPPLSAARPIAVGVVHGLAGSAGVALLAGATIRSPLWASVYLALFGVGTVLGMALLTAAMSWPLGWTARQSGRLSRWVFRAPGLLSLALGVMLAIETLSPAA